MSLEPDRVERLRKKLYEKAKGEPDFRFYMLYDKVCWPETLDQAYRQAKANAGAAGVDGVRFEAHDALAEVRMRLYGGQQHVVDADMAKYFDAIPHAELLHSVARRVADGKILPALVAGQGTRWIRAQPVRAGTTH